MENKIINWFLENMSNPSVIDISSCSRIGIPNIKYEIPNMFRSSFSNKLIGGYLPSGFGSGQYDLSKVTIVGGICLLTTADMKSIYQKHEGYVFSDVKHFKEWYSSWYPRIDQLHDSVGFINNTKEIVYIAEDIFFAKRISLYTGLNVRDISEVLREVHLSQGHPTLCRYLNNYGYRGKVRCIFISEIESELNIAFKAWSRFLNIQVKESDVDFTKVEIMYTNLWLDVLDISDFGLIYEPSTKLEIRPWLDTSKELSKNNIGNGFNRSLATLSYIPFLTSKGGMSTLSFHEVPNAGNFEEFDISKELSWYSMNILFMKGKLRDQGLTSFSEDELIKNIKDELNKIYRTKNSLS